MTTLYRVIAKTTGSLQPHDGTYWKMEVLYCGDDRQMARIAFHYSTPLDCGGSYGNSCRRTICEVIEDSETDDFYDDGVSSQDA